MRNAGRPPGPVASRASDPDIPDRNGERAREENRAIEPVRGSLPAIARPTECPGKPRTFAQGTRAALSDDPLGAGLTPRA